MISNNEEMIKQNNEINKQGDAMITLDDYKVIYVDDWVPEKDDLIFKNVDKAMILPVSRYYGMEESTNLDYFILSPKRCYNRPEVRMHTSHYLNYFTKFYDPDRELLVIYYQLKYLMDFNVEYNKHNFINDIKRFILLNRSILKKLYMMNEDNYSIHLGAKKGRSIPALQYTTKHGKILMQMSVLMNMIIPLVTHFAYIKSIDNIDGFLLEVYDIIFGLSDVDMYSKMYETTMKEVTRNESIHSTLWDMQDIRGNNVTTHVRVSIENILLNLMPKYVYNKNIISLNFTSIRKNIGYKITDIKYEFNFRPLSSSNRDEDFTSEFDKFESFMIRQDEALYLQNKVACQGTMLEIERQFGPFPEDEIEFYVNSLEEGGTNVINKFQKDLIFYLFYKYFGDPESIRAINRDEYVKLMIAARRILLTSNMVALPYIISSKVLRMPNRKSVNKSELIKIEASPYWAQIKDKYRNPKMEEYILGQIAIMLSSEFKIIDYDNEDDLHGKVIENIPDIIREEFLIFVLMV